MNKQIEEAKEVITQLLKKNQELKKQLEESTAEDEALAKLIEEAKEVIK